MKVTRNTPALDGLRRFVTGLDGRYQLEVIPESTATADKLQWLKNADRDFFAATPSMEQQLFRSLSAQAGQLVTSGGNLRAQATLDAMGKAAKAFVLLRFKNSGNDVRMTPLSPQWIARKIARGWPTGIGLASQDLRDELEAESTKFTFRKV